MLKIYGGQGKERPARASPAGAAWTHEEAWQVGDCPSAVQALLQVSCLSQIP